MFSAFPKLRVLRMPLIAAGILSIAFLVFCPVASRNTWSNALAGLFIGLSLADTALWMSSRRKERDR